MNTTTTISLRLELPILVIVLDCAAQEDRIIKTAANVLSRDAVAATARSSCRRRCRRYAPQPLLPPLSLSLPGAVVGERRCMCRCAPQPILPPLSPLLPLAAVVAARLCCRATQLMPRPPSSLSRAAAGAAVAATAHHSSRCPCPCPSPCHALSRAVAAVASIALSSLHVITCRSRYCCRGRCHSTPRPLLRAAAATAQNHRTPQPLLPSRCCLPRQQLPSMLPLLQPSQ